MRPPAYSLTIGWRKLQPAGEELLDRLIRRGPPRRCGHRTQGLRRPRKRLRAGKDIAGEGARERAGIGIRQRRIISPDATIKGIWAIFFMPLRHADIANAQSRAGMRSMSLRKASNTSWPSWRCSSVAVFMRCRNRKACSDEHLEAPIQRVGHAKIAIERRLSPPAPRSRRKAYVQCWHCCGDRAEQALEHSASYPGGHSKAGTPRFRRVVPSTGRGTLPRALAQAREIANPGVVRQGRMQCDLASTAPPSVNVGATGGACRRRHARPCRRRFAFRLRFQRRHGHQRHREDQCRRWPQRDLSFRLRHAGATASTWFRSARAASRSSSCSASPSTTADLRHGEVWYYISADAPAHGRCS